MTHRLRCSSHELMCLAERYAYVSNDINLLNYSEMIMGRGHLSKEDLRAVARWKSPRSAGRIEFNSDEYVEEITSIALNARNERTRIEVLTLLDGVRWPTASVILHFFHSDPYPIVDFRALWSLSIEVPKAYTFDFWWPYVECCRSLAQDTGLDMRALDKALWQYSKENQRPA